MLGGAETYLRDLLWNVDREKFEITLYYEAWRDFEEYLNLDQCPAIQSFPVNVIEPGGHTHVNKSNRSGHQLAISNDHNGRSVKSVLRDVYKATPLGPIVAFQLLKSLNYSFWFTNKKRMGAAFGVRPVDILHIVNGGYPGATTARIAAVVAKDMNIPCVMTISSTPGRRDFPQRIERRIDDLVFDSVDKFITIADLPGQQLMKYRDLEASKIQKIFWGVNAPEPQSDSLSVRRAKAALGLSPDAFVVGSVATFLVIKGHRFLVDAVALLRPNFPNLRVVLIGDGPTLTEVRDQAAKKGVSDIIVFAGLYNNDEVFGALRAFDLFVHPSTTEGLPYVVLEAMSQGKPVVATNVGGTPDAVIPDETGLLVPSANPKALADAIESLIKDPQRAKRMSEKGYARFKQDFTIKRMVQQHEHLYEQLANGDRRK